jgi:hypothetical protein
MSPERQRELSSMGGKAAHARGVAHTFTPSTARAAGRKGGASVAKDVAHMQAIGRVGGERTSQDRQQMAENGRKGAKVRELRRAARGSAGPRSSEGTPGDPAGADAGRDLGSPAILPSDVD